MDPEETLTTPPESVWAGPALSDAGSAKQFFIFLSKGGFKSGRIQVRSATPIGLMDEGGWLRGVQEQLPVNRQGRSYSQSFAGAVVDFIGNGVQLFLAVAR